MSARAAQVDEHERLSPTAAMMSRRDEHANAVRSYPCAYSALYHLCQHPRMAPTKRKSSRSRKSVSTTSKPVKRRTAGKRSVGGRRKGLVADSAQTSSKRTAGGRRKGLVAEVVQSIENTLEGLPKKIRKTAKKTKTAASRNRVVADVVQKLESVPKKLRKAAKKKGWKV